MEGFERRSHRHTNTAAGLEVYDAWSKFFEIDVLLKVYSRNQVAQADSLAKEAVRQVQRRSQGSALLRDVIIARDDFKTGNYKVIFVYEKKGDIDYTSIAERDDSLGDSPIGLSDYSLLPLRATNPQTLMSLHEAWSASLNQKVIVKSYQCAYIDEAGSYLREALIQASVSADCPFNCRLFDIAITGEVDFRQAQISLVMELLGEDVEKDIERRKADGHPYSELELIRTCKTDKQKIAHRDVKPSNVFMKEGGGYKVGDFGASWAKKAVTQATTVAGTTYYFSPELRIASMAVGKKYDPFQSDVYSLGVTVLHMATLEFIESLNNFEESELAPVIQESVASLPYSNRFKELLASLLHFRPARRPSLESVLSQAKAMISAGMQPIPAETLVREERKHERRGDNTSSDHQQTVSKRVPVTSSTVASRPQTKVVHELSPRNEKKTIVDHEAPRQKAKTSQGTVKSNRSEA